MGPLTALLIATPIFGFAFTPPPALPQSLVPLAQVDSAWNTDASGETEAVGGEDEKPPAFATASSTAGQAEDKPQLDQATYVKQLRKRAKMAKVHRALGIATWASMAVAVGAGIVQYRNLYGGGSIEKTPCVTGDAWPNQNGCSGAPLGHAIPGFVTGGLYFTTLGLAMFMPDPDHASVGDSKYAKNVRTHKILRWVHLAGMLAQIAIGIVIANPGLGLERSDPDDYKKLQALSRAHLGIGIGTFAALTWAGTIMLI